MLVIVKVSIPMHVVDVGPEMLARPSLECIRTIDTPEESQTFQSLPERFQTPTSCCSPIDTDGSRACRTFA